MVIPAGAGYFDQALLNPARQCQLPPFNLEHLNVWPVVAIMFVQRHWHSKRNFISCLGLLRSGLLFSGSDQILGCWSD
jgi:hypothetical protein